MCGKKYVREAFISLCLISILAGCGSNSTANNSATTAPPTGISKRVLVSNTSNNVINMLDANKDIGSSKSFTVTGPTKLASAGGTTISMSGTTNQVVVIDNKTEVVTATVLVADTPFDIAISPDGKTAWAAVRNPGFVQKIDTATGNILFTVVVPSVKRLALSPTGSKLLAFSDDPQSVPAPNTNAVVLIDTANPTTTGTLLTNAAFDQPFTAVFNGSETQAFILSCGAECGGTAANVIRVDFSTATPSFSAAIPVTAATVGLVNNGNLYVAGTPLASASGSLQVISTSALTAGPVIPITNGRHGVIAMSTNSHLYIGAAACTPSAANAQNQLRGCLSIFNTGTAVSATNPVFPLESSLRQNFDVTAFQQISARNVMYVAQGAELDIFDITTDAPSTSITQIDFVGKVFGVVQIDP
jgi:YVTN family beta-propeller protein